MVYNVITLHKAFECWTLSMNFSPLCFKANYTDPQTKLRFTSSEEFSYIRLLPTDVVTGYLALRKATCIVP